MSRQSIILLDDALSLADSQHEGKIDTEHLLTVLSESSVSTSGILRQNGITPKAIKDIFSDNSQVVSGVKSDKTTHDYVKLTDGGKLRAVYYREDLLRDMINILSQAVNRHIILIGP